MPLGASSDLLEDEFREPYQSWLKTPGPATNAAMLKALHPTIEGAVHTHVGESNPLLLSRARLMALQGLRSYDPKRGRLRSHLYSHLTGLKRVNRQQTAILKVPERTALGRHQLSLAENELRAVLGREPTDDELADQTGFSPAQMARVRAYRPGFAEGTAEAAGGGQVFGATTLPGQSRPSAWAAIVYDDLDAYHKKIMELAWGMNGRRPLSNQAIAAKMQRSPGAISQAKARIQKMLDEEHELSPFGG